MDNFVSGYECKLLLLANNKKINFSKFLVLVVLILCIVYVCVIYDQAADALNVTNFVTLMVSSV